jgi:hypothetical protein
MHRPECNTDIIYLIQKTNNVFFLHYTPCEENKCWKKLKLWENCNLIILYIHILKLEISSCDNISNILYSPSGKNLVKNHKQLGTSSQL